MDAAVVTQSGRAAAPDTPYKGLTPYREEDAGFFFGRHVWAEIVTDNLKAYRLTLLYGESGVGKSSLLRAGVAHRLGEEAEREREHYGSPGLGVLVFSSWQGDVEANLVAALDAIAAADDHNGHGPPAGATLDAAIERCSHRCGGKVFLILDQFEEYFVYHPLESDRDGFAAALPRSLGRRELPLSVVISIREDAVARLDRFKSRVPNLFDNSLRLEHLEREAARDAIKLPLERWEASERGSGPTAIEPELVDAVLDEVKAGTLEVGHGAGVVVGGGRAEVETPYLQLVMSRLWTEETRAGSDVMRLATLRRLGGAHGIVGTHLETAMAALEPQERDIAARAFRYLVTRSRSKIAHSVTDLAEWTDVAPEQLEPALERLSRGDARILRPVGEGSYEIYHDVLADAILAWRAAHEASKRLEEEKRLSVAALRRRVARIALVLGLIAFAAVVALAIIAVRKSNDADDQKKLAQSREFATSAETHGRTDQDVGLWLAIAAWKQRPEEADAKAALRQVLERQPVRRPPKGLVGDVKHATAATYNATGTRILVSGTRAAELWDAGRLHRIAELQSRPILFPQFSADGSMILAPAGRTDLRVLDANNGADVARLPGRGAKIAGAAINADGSLVAVLRHDRVRFWSIPTDRSAGRLKVPAGTYSIEFTAHGDSLIAYEANRVTVSQLGGDHARSSVPSPDLGYVAFSPDARRAIALHGFPHVGTLRGVAGGKVIAKLPAEFSADFSGDGRRLITSRGSQALVWNALTGKRVRRAHARAHIENAVLDRDGRAATLLLTDGAITHWNIVTGIKTPVARSPRRTNRFVRSVEISPDGRHVIWTTTGTVPRVWTIQDDSAATVFLGGERHTLSGFAIDPRGGRLAATGTDGRVWLWRLADGKGLPTLHAGLKHAVTAAFNHDGTSLLTADADGTARLWNVASRRPIAVMRNDGTPLTDARFSPDGRLIVTADTAGRAAVWRTATTQRLTTIHTKQGRLLGAAFSPDGRSIVTAHGKGARLWDAATGRPGMRLRGDERFRVAQDFEVPHPGVEFNRDGSRVLMVGADGGLRIWETSGRRLIETRGRHRAIVNHALFSPDGRYVAAGTDDGVVDIIDATTGKLAKRLSAGDSQVVHVGFSPDGKLLVGLGNDGISRVWDIASGDRLSVTRGREPFSFYWAAFTPDGKRVVTSNGDDAVRVEQCIRCLTVNELVALARQSAQRQLTARERHEYHLDEG